MRQRSTTTAGLLLGAAVLAVAGPAAARRVPSVGGSVVVALPDDVLRETIEAHGHVPLVERVRYGTVRDQLAHPPLPGFEKWRSAVLTSLEPSGDHTTWVLTATGPAAAVGASLRQCLQDPSAWPARVLEVSDTRVALSIVKDTVTLAFTRPVGALPELLEGCSLRGATGLYGRVSERRLEAREGHILGPPSLGRIELRELGEPADLVGGSPIASGVGVLLAPFPDVLLLVQPGAVREQDPLDLSDGPGSLQAFRSEMRPDLLVSIFWAGRGGPALGILPPGLAPARPLPDPTVPGRPLPLTLGQLSSAAERVQIAHEEDDALVGGVVERMAVLLRTRGYGTEPVPAPEVTGGDAMQVFRWRPPTEDPALALLALAGEHRGLAEVEPALVEDPRLLSASLEERLEAAMVLERRWMESRAVVPLLIAERWFALDPELRGVRVRPDGIPLFDEAYWGAHR